MLCEACASVWQCTCASQFQRTRACALAQSSPYPHPGLVKLHAPLYWVYAFTLWPGPLLTFYSMLFVGITVVSSEVVQFPRLEPHVPYQPKPQATAHPVPKLLHANDVAQGSSFSTARQCNRTSGQRLHTRYYQRAITVGAPRRSDL